MSASSSRSGSCEADVDDLRARPCTCARPISARRPRTRPSAISRLNLRRAEHVGALADEHRPVVRRRPRATSMPGDERRAGGCGTRRGCLPARHRGERADVRRRRAAAAADEVEPALRRRSASSTRGRSLRASRGSGRPRRAGRRSGTQATRRPASAGERAQVVGHELRAGRAVEADVEQVGVLERDAQSASTSWPASIVPIGSMVPETATGTPPADLRRTPARCRAAPALTLRVSWQVSRSRKSAPPSSRPSAWTRKCADQLVEGDAAGDRDRLGRRARSSRRRSAAARASTNSRGGLARERAAASRLISKRLVGEAVLGEHERRAAEGVGLDDVGAGLEVAAWTPRTTSGRVRTRFSLQPSSSGPPKSAAVRSRAWSAVPVAPSSTRMRSASRSSSRRARGSKGIMEAILAQEIEDGADHACPVRPRTRSRGRARSAGPAPAR